MAKVATTPQDQSIGFMSGIEKLGLDLARARTIVHGTTAATNAVLERKGARCGLITTRGFADVLELARRTRPHLFGLTGEFEALIPRDLRFEVGERTSAEGTIIEPLNERDVRDAVHALQDRGVEAVAIHFLNSYANASNEQRCLEIVRDVWPDQYVSLGSDLLPEIREFERGTIAALNAYVQPIVGGYLERLSTRLSAGGFRSELLIMQGNGGMMTAPVARQHAVHTILSGPASGAIAAARIGQTAGMRNLITCDMGGTSFDVAVILEGTPTITRERSIDYGIPFRLPTIDIHTIGAGGGSIARITRGGMLQVGPQSAGAVPGPVCFGRGGGEPTVTDANLVLGRINPGKINGVSTQADIVRVRAAIHDRIGRCLGLNAEEAAAGILSVANAAMADAIRFMSIAKGFDPREFALFAFGGAGPMHACALARELGVPKIIVPVYPGITSALGCVLADVRHDYGQTVNRPLREINAEWIDAMLLAQATRGRALVATEGVEVTAVEVSHEADLQYQGQTHVMRMSIESPGFDAEQVRLRLEHLFRERFDVDLSDMRPMLAALRTIIVGRRVRLEGFGFTSPRSTDHRVDGDRVTRPVWFGGEWIETPIIARHTLLPGHVFPGPAIIEQLDTTTVVEPRCAVEVDKAGNLIVTVEP